MGKRKTAAGGKYLYAVVNGARERSYGPLGIGGAEVYSIGDGQIIAIVSDLAVNRLRPERRNLAAHQNVLKQLMAETTPLPMGFGMIAEGAKAVRRILSLNQQAFREQLQRVSGKVEMGLRVLWDVPNIFEYFVLTHSELRKMRDHLLGKYREPSQEDKIELGRTFDRLLSEDRDDYGEKIEQILTPHCFEIKLNPPRNEREAVNLACLIDRNGQAQFETAVFEAAHQFDNNYTFDYSGPWAPHNFVDIDLKL